MRTSLLVVLLILLVGSCRSSKNSTASSNPSDHVQGEWVTVHGDQQKGVFSFGDTLCSYGYPFGPFTRYWVKADTLTIQSKEPHEDPETGKPVKYRFAIHLHGMDTLELKPLGKYGSALMGELGIKDQQAIILKRVSQKNQLTPNRITFYSSVCFGTCPSMYLDIDLAGNVRFYGMRFTDPEGGHTAQLDKSLYNWMLRKVQLLPIDKIDRWYKAPWTDDQTMCVTIDWDNKIFQSCAYGMHEEPIELRMLFHHLVQLYNQIELTQADIEPEDFQHTDMMDER